MARLGRRRAAGGATAADVAEAALKGDVAFTPGTARAALAHREFRIVWSGALASNVGTWMQNVVLGAFAWSLTESPTFVSVLAFAQLGPILFFAVPGGVLADRFDRRRLILATQAAQMVLSFALALLARGGDPNRPALVALVFLIGTGGALQAPAFAAIVPSLVGPRDLPGAVSLQSVQMNLSRVIGPAIGGALFPVVGAAGVFVVNGLTYLFAIAALLTVVLPHEASRHRGAREVGMRALLGGVTVARSDPLVRRVLVTMALFSFGSLGFIGLMPVLAERNLGVDPDSSAYGFLYASFGLGAATGAFLLGTSWLAGLPRDRAARSGMVAFAVMLATFALVRSAPVAYPVAWLVGLSYFVVVTSMLTVLQASLDDRVRGRVMALWMVAWGGTVPLGTLAAGPVAEALSITVVVLAGAVCALVLAAYADVRAARLASAPAAA